MKEIPLTQGEFALVDDDMYEDLIRFKWQCTIRKYAATRIRINGKRVYLSMHRYVMGLKPYDPLQIDHRDRNGLNNQRSNLRISTQSQNNMNKCKAKKEKSSKFKGVTLNKEDKQWTAYIVKNKKQQHLGYFNTEIEAALAYNKKAQKLFGEFACLNKI